MKSDRNRRRNKRQSIARFMLRDRLKKNGGAR